MKVELSPALDSTPDVKRVSIEASPRFEVAITFHLQTGAKATVRMSAEEWDSLSEDVDRLIVGFCE